MCHVWEREDGDLIGENWNKGTVDCLSAASRRIFSYSIPQNVMKHVQTFVIVLIHNNGFMKKIWDNFLIFAPVVDLGKAN